MRMKTAELQKLSKRISSSPETLISFLRMLRDELEKTGEKAQGKEAIILKSAAFGLGYTFFCLETKEFDKNVG